MPFTKQGNFTKKPTDLPDTPSPLYSPSEIKEHFQNPADELKTNFNKLVDDIALDTAAVNIGGKKDDGSGSTIQGVLDEKATKITTDNIQTQVNALAINGDSSPAISQALAGSGFDTLRDKLEYTDAQLAEKATMTEVNDLLGNLADATPLFAPNTTGMTDTSRLYVNTSDGLLYAHNGSVWSSTGVQYQSTGLAENSVQFKKTDFVETGKNRFDFAKITDGRYLSPTTGALIALAGYGASDWIYLETGTYTFFNCRWICFYNESKAFISGADYSFEGTQVARTFVVTENRYARIATYNGGSGRYFLQYVVVEKGNEYTGYEPYRLKFKNEYIPVKSVGEEQLKPLSVKKEILADESVTPSKLTTEVVEMFSSNKNTMVTLSGNNIAVKSNFDEEGTYKKIAINLLKQNPANANACFTFSTVDLLDEQESSYRIVNNSDDITPIRTNIGTVGANHGYPAFTCNKNGQTQSDVGSVWTDGTRNYVLVAVDSTKATFVYPYTESNGIVGYSSTNPAADLTHVSGAANTATISISARTVIQLYPSINNHITKYYVDGKEVTADGTHYCEKFTVREKYNVMCYKEIQEYLKANIGASLGNDNIGGVVQLTIDYVFTNNGKCTISHSFKALKKVQLGRNGFIQSMIPLNTYGTVYGYVPSVEPISGYDFKNLVDLSGSIPELDANLANLTDSGKPCNRYANVIKSNGNVLYGFMMGYIPDKTDGKNSERLLNANNNFWNISTAKKSYPYALSSKTLEAGEYKTFMCYRNYYFPVEDATCFSTIENGNDTYVFIDYHTNTNTNILLEEKHLGKNITIVESENFSLYNDVVDTNGISYSVTNNYGYAILKLN